MKTIRFGAAVLGALLLAAPARAQLPGTYSGAPTLAVNGHTFGAYVPLSRHSVGLLAQLRLSFFPGVDFGFQGGLDRLDRSSGSRTLVRLGTDVKVLVSSARPDFPYDFSLGGALGVMNGDHYGSLTLGPTAVMSRTWRAGQTGEIRPYAGLGLAFTSINDTRSAPAIPTSNRTDFWVPLRVGGEFAVSPLARLVGEMEIRLGQEAGDDIGFTVGANLPF